MSEKQFEKYEINLERGIQKYCQVCKKQFGLFTKQHQCKRCFRAICSDCGSTKRQVFKQGFTKRMHRMCTICKTQSEFICDYVITNNLCFGEMSEIGKKWMKKISKMPQNHKIDEKKYKKFTKEIFSQMWNIYNYSLRELIGLLTFEFNQDDIYNTVYNVYTTVISAAPEQKPDHVATLIMFILCFCSPDKTAIICLYLIQMKNTVQDSKGLLSAYLKALIDQEQSRKMQDYVRNKSKRFLNTFSINNITVQSSIYVISRLFQRKRIQQLYTFLALVLELNKQNIIKNKNSCMICDTIILRNCSIQGVTSKYKLLNSVKSASFIKISSEQQQTKNKQSFTDSLDSNGASKVNELRMYPQDQQFPKQPFRKKNNDIEEQNFTEDSFSVINMIDNLRQSKQYKSNEENPPTQSHFLSGLMANSPKTSDLSEGSGKETLERVQMEEVFKKNRLNLSNIEEETPKMFQSSTEMKKQNSFVQPATNKFSPVTTKSSLTQEIEKCQNHRQQIEKLKQELKQKQEENSKNQKQFTLKMKEKTNQVKEKDEEIKLIKKKLEKYNDHQNQIKNYEETQKKLTNFQSQNIALKRQNFQLRKSLKKSQTDIITLRQQLQQSAVTLRMMKNKAQTNTLMTPAYNNRHSNQNQDETKRVNEMLKASLMDKNQQLEGIMKQNKLLSYQIEELNKNIVADTEKIELKANISKLQKQKSDIFAKIQELSNILMQEQSEKLELSEQNFSLRQILRTNNIKIESISS